MDTTELKRLRWRSRRGLLELDLVLERFLAQGFELLTSSQLDAYRQMLELPDNDFLDAVNGKTDLADAQQMEVLDILRKT